MKPELSFVEAIRAIDGHPDYELCTDKTELNGQRDICVYYEGSFIGKLRWPGKKRKLPDIPVIDLPEEDIRRLIRYLVNILGRNPEDL